MENNIEKFDPSKLMDGVKDRIKSTFVGLIPDDAWENLVKKEIDLFFTPVEVTYSKKFKQNSYTYNYEALEEGKLMMSPFRRIIWEFCEEKLKQELKNKIFEEYFTNSYTNNENDIHENMKKIIEEASPKALVNLMQAISLGQVNELRNNLQNYR